jgi:hypothetical protein
LDDFLRALTGGPTAKANLGEIKTVANELVRNSPTEVVGRRLLKAAGALEGQFGELEKDKTKLKGELEQTKRKLAKATGDLGKTSRELKLAKLKQKS